MRAALQKLLVAAIRSPAELPSARMLRSGSDAAALTRLAQFHHVAAWLNVTWRDAALAPELREALQREWAASLATHLQACATLGELVDALDSDPWLVVKGPALAELHYPRPDLRTYTDLDIVIPADAVDRTVAALTNLGYQLTGPSFALARERRVGQLGLVSPGGVAVDLHWELVKDLSMRTRFAVATDALLDRAHWVTIGGRRMRTLSTTDTLLHVAVHACLSGVQRLAWTNDLHQVVATTEPDWVAVVERARDWGAQHLVGAMLLRCRRLLGTPVPDDVLTELAPPRAWRLVERRAALAAGVPAGAAGRVASRVHHRAAVGGYRFAVAEAGGIARARLRGPAEVPTKRV